MIYFILNYAIVDSYIWYLTTININTYWIMVTAVMEILDACEHCDGNSDRGNRYWWLAWLPGVHCDGNSDRGNRYWWLAWLPGVPIFALRKDLVMPPRTYRVAPSYMALA